MWKKLKPLVPKVEAAALPIHPDFENEAEIDTYHYNRENYRYELGKEVQNVVRLETETIAPYDLQAVLRLAESGKLSVSEKTLLPGVACLKQVNAALSIPDYCSDDMLSVLEDESCRDDAGEFKGYGWILLLQAAKLVHLSGKKLQLTKAGEKALNDKPEKTLKTLWQRWLKNTQFDELRRMDDIKGQTGKGKRGLTALGGRRKVINEALKACPAGEWLRVSEFSKFMQLNGFNFEVTRDPWNLYIVDNNYGSLGYHGWNILQFRYILCLLFEYAGTLGMIDVAYVPPHHARGDFRELWGSDNFEFFSRYDGLMLFRINPLGAYCLGLEKGYRAPKAEKKIVLQVLENFDIVAIDSLLPGDAMLLEQFAEKTAESVWHISEEKLLDALEQGGNLEHFTGLLDARSDGMPPEVDKLLKDVIRHSQQLTEIGSAKMIECDSSALAKQIATNAKTKRHCLLAGSRMLIVPEASEKGFRNGLKSLGYILGKGKV